MAVKRLQRRFIMIATVAILTILAVIGNIDQFDVLQNIGSADRSNPVYDIHESGNYYRRRYRGRRPR